MTELVQSIQKYKAPKRMQWWMVVLLLAIFTVILMIVGTTLVAMMYKNQQESQLHYRERMDPLQTEPGLTPADTTSLKGVQPINVTTGIYVDRIEELSMRELSWTVDFYIWFNWSDTLLKSADNFQVIDGSIISKEKKDEYIKGTTHYVLYRTVARITSVFDEMRFPCDDHLLTICIEDPSYVRQKLVFTADSANSSVSSRVKIPGYSIYRQGTVEKPHSYKTSRGDPRLQGTKATFSQYRLGIWIRRDGWGFFLKMFLPLYVAVAVAILAFFIKPTDTDPRFGLGVGALFAAVANSYINSSMLPNTGVMSLADIISIIGTITILLTLIESTISLHLFDRKDKKMLSHRFDRLSFYVLLSGYIIFNVSLLMAAVL
jgi:hypothetical protein